MESCYRIENADRSLRVIFCADDGDNDKIARDKFNEVGGKNLVKIIAKAPPTKIRGKLG